MTQEPFDWLVPGLLEEKCVALVKALPKNIRKHFVPVPQMVKQCLEIEPDFKGLLQEWLGYRLRKLTGEAIPLNAWSFEGLTEHLKMNFRVIDDQGQLLDYGRDLKKLQQKYTIKAEHSFDQIATDELNFTGCIQWAFDDLPDTYQFIQKGQTFIGFPAIIDEGDSVGVRIFDTQQKAALQHQQGLMRLFQLRLKKEGTYILKNMPQSAVAELTYNRLPKHPLIPALSNGQLSENASYKEDMLFLIFYSVFVEGKKLRTQEAFEACLQEGKPGLLGLANESGKLTLEIMAQYGDIKKTVERLLKPTDPLAKDINQQVDLLIYRGFIHHTPYYALKAMPRYLKAIQYRLDKFDNNAQKCQEVNRYATRFWNDVEKKSKKNQIIPEQDPFRWALEEFRVSLFAQQLKTAYPVSVKRMDKLWDERG